jgi:hypothetical protein
MQTAAYAVAFEERTGIPIGRLVIIMAVDSDDPRWFIEKRDNWIGGFRKLRLDYKNMKLTTETNVDNLNDINYLMLSHPKQLFLMIIKLIILMGSRYLKFQRI